MVTRENEYRQELGRSQTKLLKSKPSNWDPKTSGRKRCKLTFSFELKGRREKE
jgi:hypothetical protein